jgi:hypothetical protein
MANNFGIEVTAQDKFSAIFDKLNKTVAKATRPISEMGSVVKKAADVSGLSRVKDGIAKIGEKAAHAGKDLGVLTGPMAFLGSAGTIAGIAAMADQWARAGETLHNTSLAAGMSASSLMSTQAAAQLVGISGDSAASAMVNLGSTLHEATVGRNPQALAMLNQLGIGLHKTKNGALDSKQALYDLSDAIAHQKDAQTQNFIARMFGIEDLLPAIREGGSAGLKALEDQAKRTGAVMDEEGTKKTDEFALSLNGLKSSITGVGNTIELNLIPHLKPVTDGLTEWVSKNKDTAATMTEIGTTAGILAGSVTALVAALSGLGLVGGILATGGIAGLVAIIGAGTALLAKKSGDAMGQQIEQQTKDNGGFVDPLTGTFIPLDAGSTSTSPSAAASTSQSPSAAKRNNPLNLRRFGGAPVVGGYAQFGSEEEGFTDAAKQLMLYGGRDHIDTLQGIISKWAPASENDVGSYVNDVSKRSGFAPGQHLDLNDPAVLQSLLAAMAHHEQGRDVGSAEEIGRAVAAALQANPAHIQVTAPAGSQVSARTPTGTSLPTRVEYSMPGQSP